MVQTTLLVEALVEVLVMPTKKEPQNKLTAVAEVAAKPKTGKSEAAKKAKPAAEGHVALSKVGEKKPLPPKATKVSKPTKKALSDAADLHSAKLLSVHVTHEAIELRAYFIGENRRMFGQEGDSRHDWLEAERQLRAEGYSINQALLRTSGD